MDCAAKQETAFWRDHPLVPAAGVFLVGVACGRMCAGAGGVMVPLAVAGWILWAVAEKLRWRAWAHGGLAVALLAGGAATWALNQGYGGQMHVARLAVGQEKLVALRAKVLVGPGEGQARGNRYWIGQANAIWTDRGWKDADGEVMVQWAGGGADLRRGMQVEMYGWLSRPVGALNPGAIDPRRMLAADRIFAQVRVPRPGGVMVLDASEARGESPLTAMRNYLKGKLLEHTIQEDVPAAYAMTALLLGYRDRAMADVSQSFADAGVAHLLAISGTHIVFFTGMVWGVLRLVPLRPRRREVLIAAVVGLYVLATPCGPPIVRAAVALLMVVLARLLGRPRQYLNTLAGAAVVVVLLRPMDLLDAGCQLSFVATAGLLLFSSRVHAALFGRRLALMTMVAELSANPWARRRLQATRVVAGVLVANLIGATTALPLVAYHFGQVNLWAVVAGLIALPVVTLAMAVAAVQLLAELAGVGLWLSPVAALVGRVMIWLIGLLAHMPGSAVAVRSPPAWVLLATYGVLVLWAARRRLGVSRAMVANSVLAVAVAAAGWYAATEPVGAARLTVLSSGDGSCMLLRTPRGDLWSIDAGAGQGASVAVAALRPALRVAGSRRLDGQIVTALDAAHAREAGAVMDTWRPFEVFVPRAWWEVRGQTLAGAQVAAAAESGIRVQTLRQGETLDLGAGCRIDVLWPPDGGEELGRRDLILRLEFAGKRVLIADPASAGALALLPEVRCDAIVFTGVQRGAGDAAVRRVIEPFGAQQVIWCGRGPWASKDDSAGEWNTAEGALEIRVARTGLATRRLP